MTVAAYLGLGSNLGDRAGHLREALQRLGETAGEVIRVSAIYETEPMEFVEQPWFLNAAAELHTDLTPRALMAALLVIETEMGRVRLQDKGPRLIDLDILLYGDVILHESGLTIPHSDLAGRRFVLTPLAEIAPDVIHPVLHKTARELLEGLPQPAGVVRRWSPEH
jgi:2-amino-4-hydroxy-6-hydroxymethyldihydropteridine diphosphokinase